MMKISEADLAKLKGHLDLFEASFLRRMGVLRIMTIEKLGVVLLTVSGWVLAMAAMGAPGCQHQPDTASPQRASRVECVELSGTGVGSFSVCTDKQTGTTCYVTYHGLSCIPASVASAQSKSSP